VGSFGEVGLEEQSAMLAMLRRVKALLDEALRPDGYNIGINDGAAAGQTVMHVHMHVIPRYRGDRPDPRGGIRWIIPEKADYWSARGE
jgi:diadenosine tetraphosphate (Ap4A) HIT family hydrolase